jgi:hypothetical protein
MDPTLAMSRDAILMFLNFELISQKEFRLRQYRSCFVQIPSCFRGKGLGGFDIHIADRRQVIVWVEIFPALPFVLYPGT